MQNFESKNWKLRSFVNYQDFASTLQYARMYDYILENDVEFASSLIPQYVNLVSGDLLPFASKFSYAEINDIDTFLFPDEDGEKEINLIKQKYGDNAVAIWKKIIQHTSKSRSWFLDNMIWVNPDELDSDGFIWWAETKDTPSLYCLILLPGGASVGKPDIILRREEFDDTPVEYNHVSIQRWIAQVSKPDAAYPELKELEPFLLDLCGQ